MIVYMRNIIYIISISLLVFAGCGPAPGPEIGINEYTIVVAPQAPVPAGAVVDSITVQVRNGIGALIKTARIEYSVLTGNGTISKTSEIVNSQTGTFSWTLGYEFGEQTVEIKAFDSTVGDRQVKGSPFILRVSTKTIKDVEGNIYNTTQIGTQVWTAENLKTGKYRDGTALEMLLDSASWVNSTTGGFAYPGKNAANNETFGKIYNEKAMLNAKGICPTGWHSPSYAEWGKLIEYAGGEASAGHLLNSKNNWGNANGISNNEYGFSVEPAGFVGSTNTNSEPKNFKMVAFFWGDILPSGDGQGPYFLDDKSMFYITSAAPLGCSCRCIMD